ncbi:sulfatase-like hydrolase/transferase, partial [Hungatella sp. SL.1.14]|uniref:sulfatase-like hydrolase/transferase n=1 Tax=Hungatella sp. SL.1.14 TaxID=2963703 RepID=UPI00210CFB35
EGEKSRFQDEPQPDDWITDQIFCEHLRLIGPHGANEINMWNDETFSRWPKHPGSLKTKDEAKHFIDHYDDSVKFTDDNIGLITSWLKEHGLYGEDLAIIITADHEEDLGEFGVYGEHGMADEPVCHIPLIIKWPGA